MTNRCAYGRTLVAALTGAGEVPEGYEFIATQARPSNLASHDRFCRECSTAADSTHPDAEHLRRRTCRP